MGDRSCEYPGCDVEHDQSQMVLLFRECWYCPDHALVELYAAAGERQLTDTEQEIQAELRGAQ